MVLILLVPLLNLLYFYISTFRSMCAAPNMDIFCSSLTSCFPGMLLMYFLNDFEIVPVALITLDNKFRNFFVSVMNMLLVYLFASVKLEKGHKKHFLALLLKLCYTMIFYEIGLNIIRKGELNKKLNTIRWKRMCLVDLFCLGIIFTKYIEHCIVFFFVSSVV